MKRISIIFAIALFALLSFSQVFSQSITKTDRTIYSYQDIHKAHPDGTVGKLSFNLASSYNSIKNQPGQSVVDAQKYYAGIGLVINEKFSERQSFTIIKEFETTFEISFGLSYYLASPLQKSTKVNPDGKIGSPVVSLDAVMLLDNFRETKTKINYKTQILLPLTQSYSIFGGYTVYDEISSIDVEKFFGGLHIYLSSYSPFSKFANPDSPLSGMAISLSGGTSDFGTFGQLQLSIPSSKSVTVKLSARSDFLKGPHDKAYIGSLQVFYYSGK